MIPNDRSVRLYLCVILFLLAASAASADDSCLRALSFAERLITSSSITSAAYGDFDEDGHPDVALMLDGDSRIIALSRGSVFRPMPREQVGPISSSHFADPIVAATDVNHDGHVDLIYRRSNAVWVAFGRGNGTFQPLLLKPLSRLNNNQWRIVDFNHDGLLDFVDFDFDAVGFTFAQSKGDGTFEEAAHVNLTGVSLPNDFGKTAGDFDGDGHMDVVRFVRGLAGFVTVVTVGWNDGNLHFTEDQQAIDVLQSNQLAAIDIDGDGAEELVGIQDGSLVIMRARNRRFVVDRIPVAPRGTSQVFGNPTMMDADGDGIRDLVFSAGTAMGVVWGIGDNRFRDATYFELGSGGFTPVDIDGDGVPDFAATGGNEGLSVLYGATLAASRPNVNRVYSVGFMPTTLDLVDVDGDGSRDLVATSGNRDEAFRATILFGDGRGGFQRVAKPFVVSSRRSIDGSFVGDFDGDGHADLAITSREAGSGKPIVAFGSADGFGSPSLEIDAESLLGRVFLGASSPRALIALKGDDVQLITISSGRNVTATTIYHRPTGAPIVVVKAAATAPAQIAVITTAGIRLITRASDGWRESVLTTRSIYSAGTAIVSADLNGDGRADFLVSGSSYPEVFFAESDGSYRIQGVASVVAWGLITPVDFDGDGLPDLVITATGARFAGIAQVLHNTGGSFEVYATATSAAPYGSGVVFDDVDGDGRPDLMIPSYDGVELLKNICATPRVRVTALPAHPVEGSRVTLVVHAISTDGLTIGGITISEGSRVLASQQPFLAYDLATVTWISPPLSAGTHVFRVGYEDFYAGSSEINVTVTALPPQPRRRSVRH
ncbi:MAG: hypothetical protein QOF63_546 [Thermoanaerobaculia bacterium]|jgi:hypothetical protein|nr:hypothetical protein [Thermoanaerobaculia bacterium]